jgi:hypothetical protein
MRSPSLIKPLLILWIGSVCFPAVLGAYAGATYPEQKPPLETQIVPHPQDIFLKGPASRCYFHGKALIVTGEGEQDSAAVRLLQAEIKKLLGFTLQVCAPSSIKRDRKMIIIGTPGGANKALNRMMKARGLVMRRNYPGEEGYILDVARKAVVVAGHDERGVYYGICTLVQLFRLMEDRRGLRVEGLKIIDFPDMAFRSAAGFSMGNGDPKSITDTKTLIRRLSRLKYNMASLNNHNYPMLERTRTHHGFDAPAWLHFLPLWEYCRFWHMTPRVEGWPRYFPDGPYTAEGFPNPYAADPTTLEGVRLSCLLQLKKTRSAELYIKPAGGRRIPAANVLYDIRSGKSWPEEPVIVTDQAGNRVYEEGRDYVLEFGEIRHPFFTRCHAGEGFTRGLPRWAESDNPATTIRRTENSQIPDGGYVKVVFTQICPDPWRPNKFRYCRSDARLHQDGPQNYLWRFCTDPIRFLGARQFCLSVDETRCLGQDQRCRRRLGRGETAGSLWAKDIQYYYRTIRSHQPGALIMMWSDMIDPFHNAAVYDCRDAADRIIALGMKDILMMPWSLRQAEKSLRFLRGKGFRVMASCQEDCEDAGAQAWSRLIKSIFRRPARRGLQYTTWDGNEAFGRPETWRALQVVAEEAWSTPPYVLHVPIESATPRIPIQVTAYIEGDPFNAVECSGIPSESEGRLKITNVWLYYKKAGRKALSKIKMSRRGNKVIGYIPSQEEGIIEYAILVQSGDDAATMLPKNARSHPLRLRVEYR